VKKKEERKKWRETMNIREKIRISENDGENILCNQTRNLISGGKIWYQDNSDQNNY
jgi:hypothetical protein